MSLGKRSCVVIVCDGGCSGPWEDGIPHFDSEAEAVEYARAREWVVTDQRALCPRCATQATCKATGHQWDDWGDAELHGVWFRKRWCDHCGHTEYDPPFKELSAKFRALRDAEQIVAKANAEHQLDILQRGTPGNLEEA